MSKKDLPAHKSNNQNISFIEKSQEISFSTGPIPTPQDFEYYEKVLPGAADRILVMAEKEQESRQQISHLSQTSISKVYIRGQLFGFILGFVGLLGTVYLMYHDKSMEGGAVFIGSIGILAWNSFQKLVYTLLDRSKNKPNKT